MLLYRCFYRCIDRCLYDKSVGCYVGASIGALIGANWMRLSMRHRVNIDLMKYNSVISAIPNEWKRVIKERYLNAYSQDIDDKIFIK